MAKMKAVLCTEYGEPDVLVLDDVRKPIPKDDEVLIRVFATAVTASDCAIRGLHVPGGYQFPIKQLMRLGMRLFLGFMKPRNPILGLVFSGEVETVGQNIESFKVGDEVFGFTGNSRGAYAEYKCVSSKEIYDGEMILKPSSASHIESAAIVYGGVLATHFLKNTNLKKGKKVLIYGASGAIGTMAIQLCKHLDTEVTAVCSNENFELVASLGADKMIDYTRIDAVEELEIYDLVFDAVGKNKTSNLKDGCKESLAHDGAYVSVDDGLLKMEADYLPQLRELYQNGDVKAVIDKIYPLENSIEAHAYVEKGHKRGNVIMRVF